MIRYNVGINGIEVSAVYSEQAVNGIFLPLLKKLTDMHRQKGSRLLVMLAAPPGAGKSTLLSFLQKLSEEDEASERIQTIGMDGFHRRQEYLLTHSVMRDGKEISMVKIKGAPITFDLEKLKKSVRRVADGETIGWPAYDRLLHNPVEDAITIDGGIVLLEGNYLLLDEEGWSDLPHYADYTISIQADEELLRERLIDRRIKTGVEKEEAIRFVDFSDMPNVRLCLKKTMLADLELRIDGDGKSNSCAFQVIGGKNNA